MDDLKTVREQVVALYQAGRYAEALPLAEEAAQSALQSMGADHPKPRPSEQPGGAGPAHRKYEVAERLYGNTLLIRDGCWGQTTCSPSHRARTWPRSIWRRAARRRRSRSTRRRCMSRYALRARHPDPMVIMHEMAVMYRRMGRFEQALTFQKRLLATRQTLLGNNHPHTATALHGLAVLHTDIEVRCRGAALPPGAGAAGAAARV